MTDLSTDRVRRTTCCGAVDANTAKMFNIIPVRRRGQRSSFVALSNPSNTAVLEDLRFMTGGDVEGVLALRRAGSTS